MQSWMSQFESNPLFEPRVLDRIVDYSVLEPSREHNLVDAAANGQLDLVIYFLENREDVELMFEDEDEIPFLELKRQDAELSEIERAIEAARDEDVLDVLFEYQ